MRHPSYLGICILSSMPGLVLGSIVGFTGMFLTSVIHAIYRINVEEEILFNQFGEDFLKYRRKTYRILPYIY